MKTVKVLSFILALGLFSLNLSFAQSSPAPSEAQKAEMEAAMQEFVAAVNITEDQKEEFKAITMKYAKQMQAVRDGKGGKLQKMQKVKGIRKDKNAEMKALLTAEQYEKYLIKQKEMQDKMRAQRGRN